MQRRFRNGIMGGMNQITELVGAQSLFSMQCSAASSGSLHEMKSMKKKIYLQKSFQLSILTE